MIEFFSMMGAAFFLVFLMMVILWGISVFQKNSGIIDIGWALGFVFCALIYAFFGSGFWLRDIFMIALVGAWAGRLAWHLIMRYDPRKEDPRYIKIREQWVGKDEYGAFVVMFLFQGTLVIFLSIPFLIIGMNSTVGFNSYEVWGALIAIAGIIGEYFADRQLRSFTKDENNQGEICKVGLWNYSRHPNYFFEFVIWVGFAIIAFGAPWGFLGLYAPVVMYFFLTQISGIPPLEAHMLESRGDAYKEYQKTTSAFMPWFPHTK